MAKEKSDRPQPSPKPTPHPIPRPKPHPATDENPDPEEAQPVVKDKAPKPSYDVKTEPDTHQLNSTGHLEIKGKHVASGPNETRLFQDDIGSKEFLTKAQAKAKGKHWKD